MKNDKVCGNWLRWIKLREVEKKGKYIFTSTFGGVSLPINELWNWHSEKRSEMNLETQFEKLIFDFI